MIKAIFFDIDGTLYSHKTWQVPPSALKALYTLKEKGVRLFIASGRPPLVMPSIQKNLQNFPFDGYVLMNGQYCTDADGTPFHRQALPTAALEQLVPWLATRPDMVCVFTELDYAYTNHPLEPFAEACEKEHIKLRLRPVEDPVRCLTHPTYQLNAYIPIEKDAEFIAHAPGLRAVRWNTVFSDVIPADGGKVRGLQRMLDRFGIRREESMAFGDAGNDVDMLEFAGISVALGNGMAEAKAVASYVTDDIDDDGVAKALEHFGLL